jgi:hypothetical protein
MSEPKHIGQVVPENAGAQPATIENPSTFKPVVDFPSTPEEIKMPDEIVSNQSGGYPGGMKSN